MRVGEEVELVAPSGRGAKFAYRKVYELFLLLQNSGEPVSREALWDTLWPSLATQHKQTNLRQAVCHLRRMVGRENLVTIGAECSFAEGFRCIREAAGSACSNSVQIEAPQAADSPVGGFARTLAWFAERDPVQMLDMMRSNLGLSVGIWPQDLQQLMETASRRLPIMHRLAGWVPFWNAMSQLSFSNLSRSDTLLQVAAEQAYEAKDYVLLVEALVWLGATEILLRRLGLAEQIAQRAERLCAPLSDPALKARMEVLRATILVHRTRTAEGVRLLEEVSGAFGQRILDLAQNEALRAFYFASAGEPSRARQIIDWPSRVADETHHFRLESICGLTHGYIALQEGEQDHAVRTLDAVIARSSAAQGRHYEIYGREAAAIALCQMNERGEAAKHLIEAKQLRGTLKMGFTDWDRLRLKPLAGLSLSA